MRKASEPDPVPPSIAVSMEPWLPWPLIVPAPLYFARAPAITSHSYAALRKLRSPALNRNSVLLDGILAPRWYRLTNPNRVAHAWVFILLWV